MDKNPIAPRHMQYMMHFQCMQLICMLRCVLSPL
jgi:hypothetical protein